MALRVASVAASFSFAAAAANLLYIVVDDLRAQLGGAYGVPGMVTPSIDGLMARGTTFTRAYTNVPVCSPSRTSFLTGMRPRHTRTWTIGPYFRDQAPNAAGIVTVTQALKAAGFNTTGAGKVWHPGTSSGGAESPSVGGDDMPQSWSYPGGTPYCGYWECDEFYNGTVQSPASVQWPGGTGCVQTPACVACFAAGGVDGNFSRSWAAPDCADTCFPDGLVAGRGVEELLWKAAHGGGSGTPPPPFALFLGMKRPHLAQFAPPWAYATYDNGTLPLAAHQTPPPGMPEWAFYNNSEISGGRDVKPAMYPYTDADGTFDLVGEWKQHELVWAYRSAVTFMDAQVGVVLRALRDTGLANSTWVVLHGDHGWSLGEHGEWAKQNHFEPSHRVPLIICPPTGPAGAGYALNASFPGIVELVDVFPTLVELLGLEGGVPDGQLAGDSLVAALRGEGGAVHDPAHTTAFAEISRGVNAGPTSPPPDGSIHGLTLRTRAWRFSAWLPFNYTSSTPLWGLFNASWVELYDHSGDEGEGWEDPDATENENLAGQPQYAPVVASLLAQVQGHWPGAV